VLILKKAKLEPTVHLQNLQCAVEANEVRGIVQRNSGTIGEMNVLNYFLTKTSRK